MAEKISEKKPKKVKKIKKTEDIEIETVRVSEEVAPVAFPKKEDKDTSLLVLFKVQGRKNWRFSNWKTKQDFDNYLSSPAQHKHPAVISRKWFVVDLITGHITEEK